MIAVGPKLLCTSLEADRASLMRAPPRLDLLHHRVPAARNRRPSRHSQRPPPTSSSAPRATAPVARIDRDAGQLECLALGGADGQERAELDEQHEPDHDRPPGTSDPR